MMIKRINKYEEQANKGTASVVEVLITVSTSLDDFDSKKQ